MRCPGKSWNTQNPIDRPHSAQEASTQRKRLVYCRQAMLRWDSVWHGGRIAATEIWRLVAAIRLKLGGIGVVFSAVVAGINKLYAISSSE